MTDETRPLALWAPDGERPDLAPVRAAKAALALSYRVVPTSPEPGERVLAFGKPPFVCDFFLVSEQTPPERMQRALAWVLGEVEHDDEATMMADTLSVVFGGEVTELTPEELASERAWDDFFAGR